MRPQPYVQPLPVRGRISRSQPKGLPIVNMGFNELPFGPLPEVEAALQAMIGRVQSYGSPACDALRDALGTRHGLDPEQIVCGNGSEDLLDVVTRCFARPGDEVLISEFGYIQFTLATARVGAKLVKAPEVDWTTDIDALLGQVTDRTRVLFLANPNNPTGTMVRIEDLQRLADALPASVVLVLDLAYGEFATPGYPAQVHALASSRDNVVVTRTFSKAYGLAGVRVGWCHAPAWMVPILYAARAMGPVNALAQSAALAGLEAEAQVQKRVEIIVDERARLTGALGQLGLEVVPSHTNFLMARIRDGDATLTEALVQYLFDEGGFVVNRTREAGLETFFRFSLALPAQNDAFVACIRQFQDSRS